MNLQLPRARGLAACSVDALLLGCILAAADSALGSHGGRGALPAIGVDMACSLALATPLFVVLARIARTKLGRHIHDAVRDPGPRRAAMVTALAGGALLLAAAWAGGILLLEHALSTYHSTDVAVVVGVTELVGVIALLACTFVALRGLARWASQSPVVIRATTGRFAGATSFALVFGGGAAVLVVLTRVLAPDDPSPAYLALLAVAGTTAILAFEPSAHLPRLVRRSIAVLAAASIAWAGLAVTRPTVRARLSEGGPLARAALGGLYRMADRDGDGVPGWLDGADCDDSNASISPLALEVAGNGIDENCSGADARAPAPVQAPVAPARSSKPLDVVLVTIDTLRADHLGTYGYSRPTTPHLDSLAREATVFLRAQAPAAVTRLSLPAILFGRYASTLPFVRNQDLAEVAQNDLPSLATELVSAGYRTHAVMAIPKVLSRSWLSGFEGADVVADHTDVDNAEGVTDAVLDWLGSRCDQPRMIWAHYIDPHYPYSVLPEGPVFGEEAIDRYDAEIAHVDAEIGRLLDRLRDSGELDHAIVVVTADHGEAFGEAGYRFHGQRLRDDQIHVPLIVAVPHGAALRVNDPVSLVSIAPTILELLQLPIPSTMRSGSLAPALRNVALTPPPVLSELFRGSGTARDSVALITNDHKLIWDIDDNNYELFDGRNDPGELHDLGANVPAPLIAALRSAMDAQLAVSSAEATLASNVHLREP